jgi:sulfur carrier protein
MPSRHRKPVALTSARGCYSADMHVIINGQGRVLTELVAGANVQDLIGALALKGDRIAVEQNGAIIRRPEWSVTPVAEGDRFEIVHFVGGGAGSAGWQPACAPRSSAARSIRLPGGRSA